MYVEINMQIQIFILPVSWNTFTRSKIHCPISPGREIEFKNSPVQYIREDAYSRTGGDREDAYCHTGGIFIRDTARDTAYSLWFNEVWPYASLNHNEYAVSRVKMPPVREYASSLFSYGIRQGIRHNHCNSMKYDLMLHWITMNMPYPEPYPVWKCSPYGSTHPP